jgi:hypothetical protein
MYEGDESFHFRGGSVLDGRPECASDILASGRRRFRKVNGGEPPSRRMEVKKSTSRSVLLLNRCRTDTESDLLLYHNAQQGLSHLGPAVRTAELCNPISAPLKEQCMSLFVRPLEEMSSTVVLVLDALDECEPTTVPRLLQVLIPHIPSTIVSVSYDS